MFAGIGEDGDMRTGDSYREIPVPRQLAGVASALWVQSVPASGLARQHRSVPSGGVELTCVAGERPVVTGPRTRTGIVTLPPGTVLAGIRLRPAAGAAVLGMPPNELTDAAADASAVFGAAGEPGRLAQEQADSADGALNLLQHLVTCRNPLPEPMTAAVLTGATRDGWRVGAVPSAVSDRQVRRRCVAATGLAPKELLRILRFQVFLALVQRETDPLQAGLADLAALAGYADQPHLTRECLRLAGQTPGEFVRQISHSCAGEHDHRASVVATLEMSGLIKS
jgi:AraC-like DNA-binding protein